MRMKKPAQQLLWAPDLRQGTPSLLFTACTRFRQGKKAYSNRL
jgi:hypothetical protein